MDERAEKSRRGEEDFAEWLDANGLGYVRIGQDPSSFASLFADGVKRPDFLVVLESLGLLAVDVKNYTCSRNEYTLSMKDELRRSLTFERIFRLPFWYAYRGEPETDPVWYWISGLMAVEVGDVRRNKDTGEQFLAIALNHFARVTTNADLGKLYALRLPSIARISAHVEAGLSGCERT